MHEGQDDKVGKGMRRCSSQSRVMHEDLKTTDLGVISEGRRQSYAGIMKQAEWHASRLDHGT